jgi:N-terminal acetyltransferase B complex non-catalytic subunit
MFSTIDKFSGRAMLLCIVNSLGDQDNILLTIKQDGLSDKDWQIHVQNVLKITHLITSSVTDQDWRGDKAGVLEYILNQACKSSDFHEPSSPGGFLAIYVLLRMHHSTMRYNESHHPFESTPNSRLLLQATMLARHLVACDKEKQDRPRALLAARLHLNLGLGKSGFQMYSYTKCKEMLVHTLSPYVLSRISLTHPFGAKGYQGFSAEEELGKAIGTMERMESKTDDTIYPDLQAFPWDQAIGLLTLRRKLKSSLTKHICSVERRRIARLKGEPVDQLPVLDRQSKYTGSVNWNVLKDIGFQNITDLVDPSVFPDFENTQSAGTLSFVMANKIPNVPCIIDGYSIWESSSRVLYKEIPTWENLGLWVRGLATPLHGHQVATNMMPAESKAESIWLCINTVVEIAAGQENITLVQGTAKKLSEELHAMRLAMEKLRMPGATNLKLEDEPTMFHENMLISCYTKLELLRALVRMVDHLREKVISPKSVHPMKSKLPKDWINDIESETKVCYEAIRSLANSYINLIEQKGTAAIKAQMRWGKTGEILQKVINDSDVESYAAEYVDSALNAWKGVLQVKLK